MNTPAFGCGRRRGRLASAGAVVLLGVLIALLQGPSVGSGLFMDDYAHFRQLRECDWSLAGLTAACRLELVGGVVQLWWLPETTLRFFRPVAFGLMKLTYTLAGWSPVPMHVASLLWHLATCVLLMVLLRRLGASRWLAWAVAALFAIHPAHVATVQWIACQTELMVTAFLLAATLCFGRFRGWPGFADSGLPRSAASIFGWAAASAVFFLLALGCRENAAVFPLVLVVAEPLVRGRRRPAFALYAVLGALLVVYLGVRAAMLGGAALPPRPYVMPAGDPDFGRFLFDKLLYYLLGEYLLVPCVPIGGLPFCQARPLTFYGLAALVLLALVIICLRWGRGLARVIGPAWLLGFMLPVLPVFASPHHLYLPGVGWAVTIMLALRGLGAGSAPVVSRAARLRRPALWACILVLGALFGVMTFYFGMAFETGQEVEDCLAAELAATPSGLQDGDVLYVANLPVLGHYARLAVEERTGRRNLRLLPLTWSPRLLGPATPTELTWVNDRTIDVRVAGDRYFGGVLGLLIREATTQGIPAEVDRMDDLGFRVRVLERDDAGIAALRFEFQRRPSPPGVHLFWGSRTRWAYEVRP
jgi:hypothetical protein